MPVLPLALGHVLVNGEQDGMCMAAPHERGLVGGVLSWRQ